MKTLEHRINLSKAMIGNKNACGEWSLERKNRFSLLRKGMKFSEEHKKNMSISRKGKTLSELHKNKISEGCKKLFGFGKWMIGKNIGIPLSLQTRLKIRQSKLMEKSSHWKGWTIHKGYKIITLLSPRLGKRLRIPEHRLIMSNYLKRELTSNEIVHHIDGDTLNNSIDNLMLFSNAREHLLFHKSLQEEQANA